MRIIYAIILALILAFPALAQRTPKTITADVSTSALLWPTNLWDVERGNIYSSLGLWSGATNQTTAAWRAALGLSENTTNTTAAGWRSAIGVGEISTNTTAAGYRAAIGASESITNSTPAGFRLAYEISDIATNTLPANWRAAIGAVANSGGFLTNATISGSSTFSGTILSGSTFTSDTNVGLAYLDANGDAIISIVNGRGAFNENWPVIVDATDAYYPRNSVAVSNVAPSAGAILNRGTADYRYGIPTTYSKTGLVQAASASVARNALGFDAAAPGALGTNLVAAGAASTVRSLLGLDAGAPGAIGTNLLVSTTAGGARSLLGVQRIINMVTDYGADNTGASDCGVILQSAVTANAAGTLYYFPEGTYKFTTPVDINKSIRISAPSRDLVTITNARGTENAIFRVNNSAGTDSPIAIPALGAITTLTTNALPGDEYLSVANNASLVPNTKYLLWSTNTAYSNNGYYPAEIITIRTNSTGSTNLTYVVGDLHREYNLGETSISDLPAVIDMTVENITFRGGNTPPSGVGNKVLAGVLFSSLKFKGCRFMDIGANLGNVAYSDDVVFEDCAFRGYGRLISNAGYAFSLSMVTRPKVLNCTFRDLQMQMWIDCTAGLVSDCSGWNVACPVQFHGGNRGCVLQNITLANVNSTDGSSIAYQNYGCVYKNIHHTNPRSTGFVLQNETNCVLSNLSVTWPVGKDGDPASYSASGMLLTRCENVFIDGFTTLGAQASAAVQLIGGTGKLYLRGVSHQGSGGTGYLLANVTTVTAHEVVLDNCHSGNRLVNDMTGGFPSITIRNATCAQSIDTACGLSHTEPNNILELSGIFGGTQASYLSPLFNNRGGMTARKPSDNSAQYGFYVTEIFPGRGAGQVVRWHTYTNNAQTQVTNSLPHDSRVVRSGQQFTIINGDAAVTMNGSKAEGVAVFETGIGELYKFPTNTQNRWITVEYRGATNYWPGTSNNWKIVAASPELGIFRKVGTVTISADGTVTNTFAPPFLSGVTPIISVTPTVSTGGTNYFVSSADNTKFLMTGPIGVTFNWAASNGGH